MSYQKLSARRASSESLEPERIQRERGERERVEPEQLCEPVSESTRIAEYHMQERVLSTCE